MKPSILIKKYNIPVPRYTSYPTVPMWDEARFSTEKWKESIKKSFVQNKNFGIGLYIHLPYCESLCTFCGCNKLISKSHAVEGPYIELLMKEWKMYQALFGEKILLSELHLGGGSPSFFSPINLHTLLEGILSTVNVPINHSFSFEGNPRNTTKEQLEVLRDFGFNRISFGVQDYDEKVQFAINRLQTFDEVTLVTETARELGFTSVSHDLIYGLPFQTEDSIRDSIEKTILLKPERIAFYSYAHVPWLKGNGQRGFDEKDLPKDEFKRHLYETGKELFLQNNYIEVGMDHFTLPGDELFSAKNQKQLHRNFMGYTTSKSKLQLGLGISSIGDSWYAFAQNEKSLLKYSILVESGELPMVKGHMLSDEDLLLRTLILDLSCHYQCNLEGIPDVLKTKILERLRIFEADGIVEINQNILQITLLGKPFLRNVCSAFDSYLHSNQSNEKRYSMAI